MDSIIKERSDRMGELSRFTPYTECSLVREHMINSTGLTNAIEKYIQACLQQFYKQNYHFHYDWLHEYSYEIKNLPNITPNGLILPKVEVLLEYNLIIKEVIKLIKTLEIKHIDRVYCPINIRLVDGTPNIIKDSRPRSSTKPHVDIWAGEFTNSCMVHIPIAGNMSKNGLSLYEPGPSFFPKYVRTFNDFDEGKECINDAKKFDLQMQIGNLYLTDSFVIHKTEKREPGLRLIASFTMLYKDKVSSDIDIETNRYDDFINFEDWLEIGTTKLVTTKKKMEVYREEDIVSNMYADQLEVLNLC